MKIKFIFFRNAFKNALLLESIFNCIHTPIAEDVVVYIFESLVLLPVCQLAAASSALRSRAREARVAAVGRAIGRGAAAAGAVFTFP